MITEQEYLTAIILVRNYMAQIEGEIEESNTNLSIILNEQDLSVRCLNYLYANDLKTTGDLVKKTQKQLLYGRNFGKKSLQEIKDFLSIYGLKLKEGRK